MASPTPIKTALLLLFLLFFCTISKIWEKIVKIIILGDPIPLKRPRFSRNSVYNPHSTIMKNLSFVVKKQLLDNEFEEKQPERVKAKILFKMKIPASLSKKKQLALAGQPHNKKPDIDNLIKFCLDLLVVSGAIKDDSIISTICATKTYGESPSTIITLEEA